VCVHAHIVHTPYQPSSDKPTMG